MEHNLSFKASNHSTKIFRKMFPDCGVAKKFACGRTKTSATLTEAWAPYHDRQMLFKLDKNFLFSVMMDESNKTNKSFIVLIQIFDIDAGDIQTKFIDMPVINIGTALNLFNALKLTLKKKGLSFDILAFMSDNTNVMKGARSGVQKLKHNESPHLYDVMCMSFGRLDNISWHEDPSN